jgi:predicted nucleic acid-binding protein
MTVLVDSSAWTEYIRATGSPVDRMVLQAVSDGVVATTDAVRLELLAGGYCGMPSETLSSLLDGCRQLDQEPTTDVEEAAQIFRICRRGGETIRSLNDCLIAAIAMMRHAVPVLHCEKDFDVIALHTELQVVMS